MTSTIKLTKLRDAKTGRIIQIPKPTGVTCTFRRDARQAGKDTRAALDASTPIASPSSARDKAKLAFMRKAIKDVIAYPPKGHPYRAKDGYPSEFSYDEWAYKRMVTSVRDGLRAILKEADAL